LAKSKKGHYVGSKLPVNLNHTNKGTAPSERAAYFPLCWQWTALKHANQGTIVTIRKRDQTRLSQANASQAIPDKSSLYYLPLGLTVHPQIPYGMVAGLLAIVD